MTINKKKAPVDPAVRSRRRKSSWGKAGRWLLVLIAIVFLVHSGLNIYASYKLNRELAKIRALGQPLTLAEMRPAPVPAGQNAADLYLEAHRALKLSAAERRVLSQRAFKDEKDRRASQVKLAKILSQNRRAVELVRRASALARCDFRVDWATDNPTALNFPHFMQMRELARLIRAQALYEARSGNQGDALADALCLYTMARQLSQEPMLIGFLVASSLQWQAEQSLAEVLEVAQLTPGEARTFEGSVPVTDWEDAFHHALLGERAWEISSFQAIRHSSTNLVALFSGEESSFPRWLWSPLLLLWSPVFKLDEVQTLKLWEFQLNDPRFRQVPRPVMLSKEIEARYQAIPSWSILTRTLLPVFNRAADNRDNIYVRRAQRQVALALAVHRTQTGSYPKTLNQLPTSGGSKLPVDPYSGKPFFYEPKGNWFLLYSVGPNRKDDGGKGSFGRRSAFSEGDDIAWGDVRRDENSD